MNIDSTESFGQLCLRDQRKKEITIVLNVEGAKHTDVPYMICHQRKWGASDTLVLGVDLLQQYFLPGIDPHRSPLVPGGKIKPDSALSLRPRPKPHRLQRSPSSK